MGEVIFHSQNPSVYLWTATTVAAEKGVGWKLKVLEPGSETHRRLHPFAKSPVLQHGAVFVYETLALAHYIDRTFDGPNLHPADVIGQSDMLRWISLVNAYMFPTMTNGLAKERLLVPMQGGQSNEDVIAASVEQMTAQLALISQSLRMYDFLVGKHVTLADCFLLPHLHFASMTPEGAALLQEYKLANKWLTRMRERRSFALSDQFAPKAA